MTAAPRTPGRPTGRPSRRRPRQSAATVQEAPGFAPLKTERLTPRPFQPENAAGLHSLINNFDIAKMLELVAFPYHRKTADEWIVSSNRDLAAGTACQLAITGHEGEREVLVGGVGITVDRPSRTGRLGYWSGQKYWGLGAATEAAGRLTRWSLANFEIDRITAGV